MMRDYDFLAVPVVDFQNHLLGIITVDDILDVMDEEASDDYSKLAAMSDVQQVDDSPLNAAKKRLRSEEHTSELQSRGHLVCRLLLEKKKQKQNRHNTT